MVGTGTYIGNGEPDREIDTNLHGDLVLVHIIRESDGTLLVKTKTMADRKVISITQGDVTSPSGVLLTGPKFRVDGTGGGAGDPNEAGQVYHWAAQTFAP